MQNIIKYADGVEIEYNLYSPDEKDLVLTQKGKNYNFKDLEIKQEFTIKIDDNGNVVSEINEEGGNIIKNILYKTLIQIDFLYDNLGQDLANAYISTNIPSKKTFVCFDNNKNQAKILKEFQERYFSENDVVEFKVGIIENSSQNHSIY